MYGIDSFTEINTGAANGPLVFDARINPHHAPPVEQDAAQKKVLTGCLRREGVCMVYCSVLI